MSEIVGVLLLIGACFFVVMHLIDFFKLRIKYPDYKRWKGIYERSGRRGFHRVINIERDEGCDYYVDSIIAENFFLGWVFYEGQSSYPLRRRQFVYEDGSCAAEEVMRRLNKRGEDNAI